MAAAHYLMVASAQSLPYPVYVPKPRAPQSRNGYLCMRPRRVQPRVGRQRGS